MVFRFIVYGHLRGFCVVVYGHLRGFCVVVIIYIAE